MPDVFTFGPYLLRLRINEVLAGEAIRKLTSGARDSNQEIGVTPFPAGDVEMVAVQDFPFASVLEEVLDIEPPRPVGKEHETALLVITGVVIDKGQLFIRRGNDGCVCAVPCRKQAENGQHQRTADRYHCFHAHHHPSFRHPALWSSSLSAHRSRRQRHPRRGWRYHSRRVELRCHSSATVWNRCART